MKNENPVLENTSFRYLLRDEITNPHYHIVAFYGCDHQIECFRFEILNLVKAACSKSFYGDKKRYYSSHQQFIKLMELAFVLKETTTDFTLQEQHQLYRKNKGPFIWHEENTQDLAGSGIHLRILSGTEINNIRLFFDSFFSYKSLEEWCTILDNILCCAHKKSTLNRQYERSYEIIFIKEFMEKMAEAMFLVFNTISLHYARLHHASDFNFKNYDQTKY